TEKAASARDRLLLERSPPRRGPVTLRLLGVAATFAAVLVLLGSLVVGLGGDDGRIDLPVAIQPGTQLPAEQRIRVEVLNGAGVAGLARRVTEELRAEGFDVVYYGNAGSLTRDSTTILDRSGDAEAVAALAA